MRRLFAMLRYFSPAAFYAAAALRPPCRHFAVALPPILMFPLMLYAFALLRAAVAMR